LIATNSAVPGSIKSGLGEGDAIMLKKRWEDMTQTQQASILMMAIIQLKQSLNSFLSKISG
jgi:hypothetical protein